MKPIPFDSGAWPSAQPPHPSRAPGALGYPAESAMTPGHAPVSIRSADDAIKQYIVPSPNQLRQHIGKTQAQGIRLIEGARQGIQALMHERDDRLLVIVGPCSIHDPRSALEYAGRLSRERLRLRGTLEVLMRVYFEKPRTTVGWKGLIQDPELDGSGQFHKGLQLARQLLLDINQLGVPAATEFLDPMVAPYLADLVSWGAIGARTTESQTHRELASGLPMPVGFKNSTSGDIHIACDAMEAAAAVHHRLTIDAMGTLVREQTPGNPDGHLILRGGKEPNYQAPWVEAARQALLDRRLPQRLLIDCSHGNSRKQHERQGLVVADVARRVALGEQAVFGMMIESHLHAGRQPFTAGVHSPQSLKYGQSITDACLDWESTVELLDVLSHSVEQRRALAMASLRSRDSTPSAPTHPNARHESHEQAIVPII